jgi:hypothetical protein
LLCAANVWLYFTAKVPMVQVLGREMRVFDVGGYIAALGLTAFAIAAAARHARALYRVEPLRKQ